jgi:hypothetical protein
MERQAPAGLLGIHTNLPAALPPEIGAALEILMPYSVRGVLAPNFARLHVVA